MSDMEQVAVQPSRNLDGIFRNSSFYLVGNIASRVIGFLAIPIYSRFLSPTQYGIIELIELSTQVVAIAFGLQSIGTVITRMYYDQTNATQKREVVSTGLIATTLVSALVALAAILAAAPLSRAVFHSTENAPLLQAAFAAMFFSNLMEVVLVYERIREHARFFLSYSLVTLFITLALNIYFIGFLGAGVWGFVYSKLIVTGVGSMYLMRRAFLDVRWNWRDRYIRQFIHLGLPLTVASVSFFAIHFSDRFFLSAAVSLADLGRYALAYRFAFLVSVIVSDSFGKSWNVTFYRLVGQAGWRQQFGQIAKYLIFAECAAGLALCLAAPELLYVMVPESFYPPTLLLPILVLAYVLRDIGDFYRNLLLINKRTALIGRLVFGGAVLNAGLNFALIPALGLYGAALATLATWSIYLVVFWIFACREHGVPSQATAVLKIIVLASAILGLRHSFATSDPLGQVLRDAEWMLLFMGLCLLLYFSTIERVEIFRIAKSVLSRAVNRPPEPARRRSAIAGVLVLAFYFPPENTIGGARPSRFVKYLARLGYRTTVVAANPPGIGVSDSNVLRVPDRRTKSPASHVIRLIERFVLPYDDRLPWIPHGYRAAVRLLVKDSNQVVISTHPPVATHLVALLLKRRFGMKWIADFRDPLLGNAIRNSRRAKIIDTVIERLIFKYADAVIANTAPVQEMWRSRHPRWASKIHLIWNGFDRDETCEPLAISSRTRRHLVHVGTIYGSRTPGPLIRSICRLLQTNRLDPANLQLRLIGPIENDVLETYSTQLAQLLDLGCLHIENRMAPKAEAHMETLDADHLVLLDMVDDKNSGLHLPAKIFDYIQACRPILAFTRPGSTIQRILADSGIRNKCIDPFAAEAVIDAELLAFLDEKLEETHPNDLFWQDFDALHQTQTLAGIIATI